MRRTLACVRVKNITSTFLFLFSFTWLYTMELSLCLSLCLSLSLSVVFSLRTVHSVLKMLAESTKLRVKLIDVRNVTYFYQINTVFSHPLSLSSISKCTDDWNCSSVRSCSLGLSVYGSVWACIGVSMFVWLYYEMWMEWNSNNKTQQQFHMQMIKCDVTAIGTLVTYVVAILETNLTFWLWLNNIIEQRKEEKKI